MSNAEHHPADSTPARILIVDDHPAVRDGLTLRLSRHPEFVVVGEAEGVPEALALMASAEPQVAIVDISLKGGNGIELIKRSRAQFEKIRFLVWSMYDEHLYAERALRAGAMGYINKQQATDQIILAIRSVLAGKVYLSENLSHQLLNRVVNGHVRADSAMTSRLSDRELQVFEQIGHGLDTQQIAKAMHISPKTVETYRARLKEKLSLNNGSELVRSAVQWSLQRD